MKQLPGKQEVLKTDFLEMRVEAIDFKSLDLEGPFPGSERVYFKPWCTESFYAEEQLLPGSSTSGSGNS